MVEQTPSPDNRVTLSENRDAFGQRRSHLHWTFEKKDRDNIWAVYDILAKEVGRLNAGRLWSQKENERLFDDLLGYGHHHMGTTRAALSPKAGVVDADLRVHEVTNLFISSSSIFPTGGHVPPTLTIVALSIRLASHLSLIGRRQ